MYKIMAYAYLIVLTGCGSLYPPQAEEEITLEAALLDTVDSLDAMKQQLVARNQRLGIYPDTVTAEFFVKGARVTNVGVSGDINVAPGAPLTGLVIKPTYSRNDTGERSNKITVVFKSINSISDPKLREQLRRCLKDPKCYEDSEIYMRESQTE